MDASYYSVPVQIGGVERRLVCNLRALRDMQTAGMSVEEGSPGFRDLDVMVKTLLILLRKTAPELTEEDILDEMQAHEIVPLAEAIAKVISGPNAAEKTDPLPASVNP
jgi:hypothetical protein